MFNAKTRAAFFLILTEFLAYKENFSSSSSSFLLRIFSEMDRPLDFNETLVNGSVLNVASLNNIRFFCCGNHYLKSYQHLKLFISYVIVKNHHNYVLLL